MAKQIRSPGQVRQLWPRIKVALREGHQLKQIWQCLVMDGLDLSYSKAPGPCL
jgi:hypothetical protein